jgi:hypothetical protein
LLNLLFQLSRGDKALDSFLENLLTLVGSLRGLFGEVELLEGFVEFFL